MTRAIVIVPAGLALYALAACSGQTDTYPQSAGYRPYYERGINQDIEATHGVDTPTSRTLGVPNPMTELDQPSE